MSGFDWKDIETYQLSLRKIVYEGKAYGERSLAGLMAQPALKAKLRWMAARPSPMRSGINPEMTFMFFLSVTARMMIRRHMVPKAWSITRVTTEASLLGKEEKIPAPVWFTPRLALMPSA